MEGDRDRDGDGSGEVGEAGRKWDATGTLEDRGAFSWMSGKGRSCRDWAREEGRRKDGAEYR